MSNNANENDVILEKIDISKDETHHIHNNRLLYKKKSVLKTD